MLYLGSVSAFLCLFVRLSLASGDLLFPDELPSAFPADSGGPGVLDDERAAPPDLGLTPLRQGGPPRRGGPPRNGQGSRPGNSGSAPGHSRKPPGQQDEIFFPRNEGKPKKSCITASGKKGYCLLLVQCAVFSSEINELSKSKCSIDEENDGVCCEKAPPPQKDPTKVVNKPGRPHVAIPNININEINNAAILAIESRRRKKEFERELIFNNIIPDTDTPVFLHAALFDATPDVVREAENAAVTLGTTVNIVNSNNLTREQTEFGLSELDTSNSIIEDTCPVQPVCPQTKYRTIDGSCNNLRNKEWGMAVHAYQRLIPPHYADGTNAPRQRVLGGPLPSARAVSSRLTIDREEDYRSFTLMVMQWGQFLDHDITHTPLSKGDQQTPISCCIRGQLRPENELHPECFPIAVPQNDTFYSGFGINCMEFVRSLPAIRNACKFGPREQMSQITAYIDASNVYGSNQDVADSLREFVGGRLAVNDNQGRHMLPAFPNALGCSGRSPFCFKAGDVRVNEQPNLVVLHTIWMRQHNRIANGLAAINPGWNDETLYQEARRIVGAQMQHITYNEYLPVVLGREFMTTFGLIPQPTGHTNTYVESADATITNAFATAAYRFGHSMVSGNMFGFAASGEIVRSMSLSSGAFAPFFLYDEGQMDAMIRGLISQNSARFDKVFSPEVSKKLFAQNRAFGMDLIALNIQRGRDHGLPSYNEWRKVCHFPKAQNFADFSDFMNPEDIQTLKDVYGTVDDVDLFIGGILERPKRGSLLGPTFLCIIGDQFIRLKVGDRYYYENGQFDSKFTGAQLDAIRSTSLARILCDNSDDLQNVQPLVFVNAGSATNSVRGNEVVTCSNEKVIPRMDLSPWTNEPVWT